MRFIKFRCPPKLFDGFLFDGIQNQFANVITLLYGIAVLIRTGDVRTPEISCS